MTTATRPLRLMETFHNLFYTPIYVAVGGEFLAQQGLDVRLYTAPPGQTAMALMNAPRSKLRGIKPQNPNPQNSSIWTS